MEFEIEPNDQFENLEIYDDDLTDETNYDMSDMQDAIDRLDDVTNCTQSDDDSDTDSSPAGSDTLSVSDTTSGTRLSKQDYGAINTLQTSNNNDKNISENECMPTKNSIESLNNTVDNNCKTETDVTEIHLKHSQEPRKRSLGQDSLSKKINPNKKSVKNLLKKLTRKSLPKSETNDKALANRLLSKPTKLPQFFVVKYLGKRECSDLFGMNHVRKPVDEMVKEVTQQLNDKVTSVELPLVYAVISHKGIDLRVHKNNKIDTDAHAHYPVDFISYGVQDAKFPRIFTFILVQEMSSRSKKLECHAMICDSPHAARFMSLSLAASFKLYVKVLESQGKEHRFQVLLEETNLNKADEEC